MNFNNTDISIREFIDDEEYANAELERAYIQGKQEKCDKCDYFISVEEAYQQGIVDGIDKFICKLIELDKEFPIIEDEYGEKRPMYLSEMCKLVKEQLKGAEIMGGNLIEEPDIEGKRVSNYRYNVYATFEHGDFKCLDVIYCIAQTRETAEELVLKRAKEMYGDRFNVDIMATN